MAQLGKGHGRSHLQSWKQSLCPLSTCSLTSLNLPPFCEVRSLCVMVVEAQSHPPSPVPCGHNLRWAEQGRGFVPVNSSVVSTVWSSGPL